MEHHQYGQERDAIGLASGPAPVSSMYHTYPHSNFFFYPQVQPPTIANPCLPHHPMYPQHPHQHEHPPLSQLYHMYNFHLYDQPHTTHLQSQPSIYIHHSQEQQLNFSSQCSNRKNDNDITFTKPTPQNVDEKIWSNDNKHKEGSKDKKIETEACSDLIKNQQSPEAISLVSMSRHSNNIQQPSLAHKVSGAGQVGSRIFEYDNIDKEKQQKSADDYHEYIRQQQTNVLAPCAEDTVIIFDWDDTLFSSSWIDREQLLYISQLAELPLHFQTIFKTLEQIVLRCLRVAQESGTVVIITNGQVNWVFHCCRVFMPSLLSLLDGRALEQHQIFAQDDLCNESKTKDPFYNQNGENDRKSESRFLKNSIRVISARSSFESMYPGMPVCWKAAAFSFVMNLIKRTTDNTVKNIISFGDSLEERTALKIVAGQLDSVSKSVKLIDLPSPDLLCLQISFFTECISWISSHTSHLDIMISADMTDGSFVFMPFTQNVPLMPYSLKEGHEQTATLTSVVPQQQNQH